MTTAPPESAVQFTAHELLALLSMNRGPSEKATRAMLKLADLPDAADLVRAGFSTLLVRELLDRQGDRVTPRGAAKVLAQVLTNAQLWVDVTVTDGTTTSVTFLIEAHPARIALFVRPGGIVMGVPLAPTVDCTAMALDMAVKNYSSTERDSAVTLRRRTLSGPTVAASIRRSAEHGWQVAELEESAPAGAPVPDMVVCRNEAEAFARFRMLLGLQDTPGGPADA